MDEWFLKVVGGPLHGAMYYDGLDLDDDYRPVNLGYFRGGSYVVVRGEVRWWEAQ